MTVKLLVQTVTYGLIAIFGFFIAIPIAVTSNKFNGFCILYGNGVWRVQKLTYTFVMDSTSNVTMCNFNVFFHVVVTILYAAAMMGIYIYLFILSKRGQTKRLPTPVVIASLVVNCLCLLLTLASGIMISAGFNSWCSAIVKGPITDCADAQKDIKWTVDGSSFHTCYLMAIICCWLVIGLWGIIVGIGAYPFIRRYRRQRNTSRATTPRDGDRGVERSVERISSRKEIVAETGSVRNDRRSEMASERGSERGSDRGSVPRDRESEKVEEQVDERGGRGTRSASVRTSPRSGITHTRKAQSLRTHDSKSPTRY